MAAAITCVPATGYPAPATPQELFDAAVKLDLEGEGGAQPAFFLFLQAAERGWRAAEFNVAVMLDSGRGVSRNSEQAALWYARAASRGDHRAAFNLGQLYESGDGVPRNASLARGWFEYSTLPAGRERAAGFPAGPRPGRALTPPGCADPPANARLRSKPDGVELVWVSGDQPEPVRFYVEVRDGRGQQSFAGYTSVSSALVSLPAGDFSWRVSAVATTQGRYLACAWSPFKLEAD